MTNEQSERQLVTSEVVKNSKFGFYRPVKADENGEVKIKVAGFFAKLPVSFEIYFMLPVIIISLLATPWLMDIKSYNIVVGIVSIWLLTILAVYYKYRSSMVNKKYNLLSDSSIILNEESFYLPSMYTLKSAGIKISKQNIKSIDFTWNYARYGQGRTSSIDLMDIIIYLKNGDEYTLPYWVSKTKNLFYALHRFNYPSYLVRVERQVFKAFYDALTVIAVVMLVIGVSIAIYTEM